MTLKTDDNQKEDDYTNQNFTDTIKDDIDNYHCESILEEYVYDGKFYTIAKAQFT